MFQHWTLLVFTSAVLYLTLFYNLGHMGFIGADEPRYARVGEEMMLTGNYVTPTLKFQPWLEKPPLLYWMEAVSFRLFGVEEWAARFPVAVVALLAILAAAFLLFDLAGPRAALLGILILSTSGLYFVYARAASTDMPLTATFTVAMTAAFQATRRPDPLWGTLAGAALGLAVLAKGPVAVILFSGIFLIHSLLRDTFPWPLRQVVPGVIAFLGVGVPWFWLVWQQNGYDFLATFLLNHHLARFVTSIHQHTQPFWFFLPVILVGFFPWVFFLGSALLRFRRAGLPPRNDLQSLQLLLWLWVAVPLVFFSLSDSKLAGYILPILPALAMLVALEWDRFLDSQFPYYRTMKVQLALLSAFSVLVGLILFFGFHFRYGHLEVGLILAVPVVGGVLWGVMEFRKGRPQALAMCLVAAMTLFSGLAHWKAAPIVEDHHSARRLSLYVTPFLSEEEPLVLYRYFHHTAQYYTGYRTTREAIPDADSLRRYLEDASQESFFLLTQREGWMELEERFGAQLVLHRGNLYLARLTSGGSAAEKDADDPSP